MAGASNVIVTGYLSGDAEGKVVSGTSVCEFSIPITPNYKDRDHTNWYRVSFWGKRGEAIKEYLKKGTFVTVIGELDARNYEGKNGAAVSLDVRASNVTLGPKGGEKTQGLSDSSPF